MKSVDQHLIRKFALSIPASQDAESQIFRWPDRGAGGSAETPAKNVRFKGKRTSAIALHMSAFDPKQTWTAALNMSISGAKRTMRKLNLGNLIIVLAAFIFEGT